MGDRGLGSAGDSHPAWMLAHTRLGEHLVVGASAIGQMHLKRGEGRDDAFLVRSWGPWLAVGVSDGLGSRRHSRFGAAYTVESLTALLLRPFCQQVEKASNRPAPTAPAASALPSELRGAEPWRGRAQGQAQTRQGSAGLGSVYVFTARRRKR